MTDFTEANRQYFDKMATTYEEKFAQGVEVVAEQTAQHRLWISDRWTDTTTNLDEKVRMLEYACGPGVISMTLAPFLTEVIGIDVSDKMVEAYNRNAATLDISDKMVGHVADLLGDNVPDEFKKSPYVDMDIVAVSMALHHFEHPDVALQRLGQRVKSGGTFFIIDLVPQPGHAHAHGHGNGHGHGHGHDHGHGHNHDHGASKDEFGDAAHTIGTHGFSEESMKNLFQQAGFDVGFKYEAISEPLTFNMDGKSFSKSIFFARAQRA